MSRNQCRAFIFCIRNNQGLKICNVKVSVWSSQKSWKYGALKIAKKIRLCIVLCRSLWTSHLRQGINVEPSYFVYSTTRGWRCAKLKFQFDQAKNLGNMELWKLKKNMTLYRFMQEFVDITSTWRNQYRAVIFCIRNNQRLNMCNVKVSVWSSQKSGTYGALKIVGNLTLVSIYAWVCGHSHLLERNTYRSLIFCVRNDYMLKICNVEVLVWLSQKSWKFSSLKALQNDGLPINSMEEFVDTYSIWRYLGFHSTFRSNYPPVKRRDIGMSLSVRPSIRPSVCPSVCPPLDA